MLGYVRVSTQEQALGGAGLAAQRSAIELKAAREGWTLVDIVEDGGVSGSTPAEQRPGLREAMRRIEAHHADGIVVAKLDRLTRSLLDFAQLMERSRRKGWSIVALDLGVDTSTPSGEMMAGVLATFAQFERRLIGQRTAEALAVKRANGVRLGRPPSVPPAVVAVVQRQRASGRSHREIAAHLNGSLVPTVGGGRQWYASTVQNVLRAYPVLVG